MINKTIWSQKKGVQIFWSIEHFSWNCNLLKIAGTCLGLRSSGGRGRRTQERARSHLCQIQTIKIIILMLTKMMMLIMVDQPCKEGLSSQPHCARNPGNSKIFKVPITHIWMQQTQGVLRLYVE